MADPYEYVVELEKVLRKGVEMVERSITHVTHGAPTKLEAEKWAKEARVVLGE